MFDLTLSATLGSTLVLVWALYRHLMRFRGTLEAMGVPVDWTSDLRGHEMQYRRYDLDCLNKHGRLWGRYVGQRAELFVADPDIVKELLVKRFEDFQDRQHFVMPEKVTMYNCT